MSPPNEASESSAEPEVHVVPPEEKGERLDVWLTRRLGGLSRHRIQLEIKSKAVTVDGRSEPSRYRVRSGDRIEVRPSARATASELRPADIELTVVHEDDSLLIVDKQPGLVVHPAPGHEDDTMVNALLARLGPEIKDIGGEDRCGLVHRLDKMTSGLLLVAKNAEAHEKLTAALADRRIDRRYLGLAMGMFKESEGKIDRPIGRRPSDRKKMGIVAEGRPAQTSYRVLHQGQSIAMLLIRLHTGRTHQIRVHLQSIGRPILGDPEYGWTKKHAFASLNSEMRNRLGPIWPGRQMLHAAALRFEHPATGETFEMTAPMPGDMTLQAETIFGEGAIDFTELLADLD